MNTQMEKALFLLTRELLDQLDSISVMRKNGFEAKVSTEAFRASAEVLSDLPNEALEKYYEILLTMIEERATSNTQLESAQLKEETNIEQRLEIARELAAKIAVGSS
jgi:hypothetical protein